MGNVDKANKEMRLLAPLFADRVEDALAECDEHGYKLFVTEGWRGPERQNYLYEQGRSRPGKIVTRARAWQSMHQYGLAVDLAGLINGKLSYEMPWDKIASVFEQHGMEGVSFERVHFQWKTRMPILTMRQIQVTHGLQGLWEAVSS